MITKKLISSNTSGADNGTMHFWDWKTGYNFQRIQAQVQPGSLDSEAGVFAMAFDHRFVKFLSKLIMLM